MDLIEKINKLKREKNAIILTHCYQRIEIDEISDAVGDSFYLSKVAANNKADIVIFAGVFFMAQSAKIIAPQKRVFLPNMNSGCLMADMIDVQNLRIFKKKNPNIPVVCYINSTAEVKAECDICCTSSNAIQVVKSLNEPKVLFVPDTYLGKWVQSKIDNIEIITFNGFCPTHLRIRVEDIEKARKKYPSALILAHPECHCEVSKNADFVGSTKEIMEFAKKSDKNLFVIATESGVVERLNRDSALYNWNKKFILINDNITCPNMKQNTLEDIYNVLLNEENEIFVDENVAQRARLCIDRMMAVI